ncbi:hypothetical protein EG328_000673 [Venturia inaequalis]|uniref:Uncharacterized protein n=1 Tax=Venturia inaequalis TaxID=5025 RepID=A0A8H3YZD9_VENIN|nr:hypothetical protein EG328_000673 [Venturia inaequalis]
MKIQTIFLLIGTAAALVPRMEQSSAVGNAFDIAACSGAGVHAVALTNASVASNRELRILTKMHVYKPGEEKDHTFMDGAGGRSNPNQRLHVV